MGVNSGRKGIIEEESYAVSRHSSDGSSVVMTWSHHTFYGNSLIGVSGG